MDMSTIMWGMIFGSIGLGFFMYGKKQKVTIPYLIGIALMVFPYIISNVVILVILGVVLVIIPFVIKR